MRPERGTKIVVWILWAFIISGLVFLFGCEPTNAKREPLVLEGGIQCVPNGNRILCAVHLEESVDE